MTCVQATHGHGFGARTVAWDGPFPSWPDARAALADTHLTDPHVFAALPWPAQCACLGHSSTLT